MINDHIRNLAALEVCLQGLKTMRLFLESHHDSFATECLGDLCCLPTGSGAHIEHHSAGSEHLHRKLSSRILQIIKSAEIFQRSAERERRFLYPKTILRIRYL